MRRNLRRAQRLDASVDRSTVYRTLQLLKRQGSIDELDLMHIHGEGHYYERKLNRDHIHMACLRCGKISEFVSDVFEQLKAIGIGLLGRSKSPNLNGLPADHTIHRGHA